MSRGGNQDTGRSEAGLTLLELLVVIFILSSMALVTVSIVDSADEQLRYEETRARLEQVKRGIAGDPSVTADGHPLVSGFVADMGRLPESLPELIEQGSLPDWRFYPEAALWAGWRGPYVEPLLERTDSGSPVFTFRDGWDHPGLYPLYGWKTFVSDGEGKLFMQSFGSDGVSGPLPPEGGYGDDYPPGDPLPLPLLEKHDYLVDVRQLSMEVTVVNNTPDELVFRLRVLYPRDGSLDPGDLPWPPAAQRDEQEDLSGELRFKPLPGEAVTGTFHFKVKQPGAPGECWPKEIPCGLRSVVLVDGATGKILELMEPILVRLIPRASLPDLPAQAWTVGTAPDQGGQGQSK